MNDIKDKKEVDCPESDKDEISKKLIKILKDEFEDFPDELENFEKKHEEKRRRLFNGNRRRTSGRII